MTFSNIQNDTQCDCLKEAVDDFDSHYIRKINKSELSEKDFATHWERQIRKDATDCNDICSLKAISVNYFSTENIPQIVEHYTTTFNFNPKKGCYYIRFRLKKQFGKFKPEPLENDESHYSMFKSDDFVINSLEIIETVKFA
jgi:hypothetical protein